jgi:hypothetical protein
VDNGCLVTIGGVLDEDNELAALVDGVNGSLVVVDLSDVERINSCGVRDWVNWLQLLRGERGARPVFIRCAPAIVTQINLVKNFTNGGVVRSFYAPYFCPRCQTEKLLLVDTVQWLAQSNGAPKAPLCRCDSCDGLMEFDDLEASYFGFVATQGASCLEPRVEAVLRELEASDPSSEVRRRKLAGPAALTLGMPSQTPPSSAGTRVGAAGAGLDVPSGVFSAVGASVAPVGRRISGFFVANPAGAPPGGGPSTGAFAIPPFPPVPGGGVPAPGPPAAERPAPGRPAYARYAVVVALLFVAFAAAVWLVFTGLGS